MGLDTVELCMRFEESLGIVISDSAAEKIRIPADVIDLAMSELRNQGKTPIRHHIAEIVRFLTLDQTGLSPKRYREDGRFAEDFGMD